MLSKLREPHRGKSTLKWQTQTYVCTSPPSTHICTQLVLISTILDKMHTWTHKIVLNILAQPKRRKKIKKKGHKYIKVYYSQSLLIERNRYTVLQIPGNTRSQALEQYISVFINYTKSLVYLVSLCKMFWESVHTISTFLFSFIMLFVSNMWWFRRVLIFLEFRLNCILYCMQL